MPAAMPAAMPVATSEARAADTSDAMPDWLEPRGLNVIELIGQVPEQFLQGLILSFGDWDGIVVYESGSRVGSRVVVTTTIYPRLDTPTWAPNNKLTLFGCLGQSPMTDHMGSVVPTSTLRVYDTTGREVTQEIEYLFVTHMDTLQPIESTLEPFRYPEIRYGTNQPNPLPLGPDGLVIPPNAGCWIKLPGADYYPLTGVFTLDFESSVRAYVLGTQGAKFRSYIGVGNVGIFQPLMDQLRARFGDRWQRIPLSIPESADYFLLKFPPMPADPHTEARRDPPYLNAGRLGSGSYRLSKNISDLSGDITVSAAFPLLTAWQDADQAPGTQFLPVLEAPTDMEPPDYVVPVGMPYNDCFWQGNCSDSILQQIYDAEMSLKIIYLKVYHSETDGQWVPLRMAGPAWVPAAQTAATIPDASIQASVEITASYHYFIPFASFLPEEVPGDCLCGWFDDLGRMLDYDPGTGIGSQRE